METENDKQEVQTGSGLFQGLGFRRRYNQQVIYKHRVFNVSGLQTKGAHTLEVEQVFVELRVAPGHIQQANVNPLAFKELIGKEPRVG